MQGIERQFSAPHAHQQNGRAERLNRTLTEKAECLRLFAYCPRSWWEFAFNMATHVYNRTPIRRGGWRMPYELVYNKKPDISKIKVFGCLAWVHRHDEIRQDKLVPKAEAMIYLGLTQDSEAFLFMKDNNSLFIGIKAVFDENYFPRGKINAQDRLYENNEYSPNDLDSGSNTNPKLSFENLDQSGPGGAPLAQQHHENLLDPQDFNKTKTDNSNDD